MLSRGDLVQASEKYYKAAEEAIKYLSKEKKYFMLFRVLEKEKMEGRIVI
ncbi:PaREP1 family protein [Sulfurisphaera tokodaii]